MVEHYTIVDGIIDLLGITPAFLIGIFLLGILLFLVYSRNNGVAEVRIAVASFVLYYYLWILFRNVVGIPTFQECMEMTARGNGIFHPSFNWIPLVDGLSFGFVMNIFIFAPLGFLVPFISRTFERVEKVMILGFGLTLLIEISQMFTMYRVSDIDDILTNVLGTILGYMMFRLMAKAKWVRMYSKSKLMPKNPLINWLPIIVIGMTFIIAFWG